MNVLQHVKDYANQKWVGHPGLGRNKSSPMALRSICGLELNHGQATCLACGSEGVWVVCEVIGMQGARRVGHWS